MERIKPRGPKAPRRPQLADRIELQEQVTELAAQQAAMSEVLCSIANSPHELEPIFDTITANATRLCRAEVGALIIFEEHGYRLVARTGMADEFYVKGRLYPVSEGAPSARMMGRASCSASRARASMSVPDSGTCCKAVAIRARMRAARSACSGGQSARERSYSSTATISSWGDFGFT